MYESRLLYRLSAGGVSFATFVGTVLEYPSVPVRSVRLAASRLRRTISVFARALINYPKLKPRFAMLTICTTSHKEHQLHRITIVGSTKDLAL